MKKKKIERKIEKCIVAVFIFNERIITKIFDIGWKIKHVFDDRS